VLFRYCDESFALIKSEADGKEFVIVIDKEMTIEGFVDKCNSLIPDSKYSVDFLEPYEISNESILGRLFVRQVGEKEYEKFLKVYDGSYKLANFESNFLTFNIIYSFLEVQVASIDYWDLDYCYICQNGHLPKTDPHWHLTDKCVYLQRCEICREHTHSTKGCPLYKDQICYWCNKPGHHMRFCKNHIKCHHCNKYGHKLAFCPYFRMTADQAKKLGGDPDEVVPPHFKTPEEHVIAAIIKKDRMKWYAEMEE
jgi:hypothetical protein